MVINSKSNPLLLSPGILLLRAIGEGLLSPFLYVFSCFICFGLPPIPYREFCSPELNPMVDDVLLVLPRLWRLFFSFSLCFFLLVFLAEGYTERLCWGAAFLVCLRRVFMAVLF
jgi:hypothetical protein